MQQVESDIHALSEEALFEYYGQPIVSVGAIRYLLPLACLCDRKYGGEEFDRFRGADYQQSIVTGEVNIKQWGEELISRQQEGEALSRSMGGNHDHRNWSDERQQRSLIGDSQVRLQSAEFHQRNMGVDYVPRTWGNGILVRSTGANLASRIWDGDMAPQQVAAISCHLQKNCQIQFNNLPRGQAVHVYDVFGRRTAVSGVLEVR